MAPLVREMLVLFFLRRGCWTSESPNLIVQLTDDTEVAPVQGIFKARRKRMSMAALVPGLAVQVEGAFNEKHELLAKWPGRRVGSSVCLPDSPRLSPDSVEFALGFMQPCLDGLGLFQIVPLELHSPIVGNGAESREYQRLHDPGKRLCLLGRQCLLESEAQRRPRGECNEYSSLAEPCLPYQNARSRCDGRSPSSRQRQDR